MSEEAKLEEVDKEPEEKTYVASNTPKLKIRLASGKVQFKNGVLKLSGDQMREMDMLLSDGEHVSLTQMVRVLDREKAEQISKEFQERAAAMNKATPGGVNSAALRSMADEALAARDKMMRDASPEDMQKLHEQIQDDLQITEPVKNPEVAIPIEERELPEGFIPNEQPATPVPETEEAEKPSSEGTIANLLADKN